MDWKSNLFWCIMGIIGGSISSYLISLYFYLKGFKNKKILFSAMYSYHTSFPSILYAKTSLLFDVDINKYNHIARFKIRINGKSSIEANSFANHSPLKIHFNHKCKIVTNNIKIKIIPSNPENIISYTVNDNDILLNFECLGKGETIFIYILYFDGHPTLKGYLKDGKISSVGDSFLLYFIYMTMKIVSLSFLFSYIIFLAFWFIYYKTNLHNIIDIAFFKYLDELLTYLKELYQCQKSGFISILCGYMVILLSIKRHIEAAKNPVSMGNNLS